MAFGRKPNLQLSLDTGSFGNDSLAGFDTTFRDQSEGISISVDAVRVHGVELGESGLRSKISIGKKLGNGACSTVYYAENTESGERYAVKAFNVYDRGRREQMVQEISILANVKCDALVAFFGAYNDEGSIHVILEYMDKGTLEYFLEKGNRVTEKALACVSYQILWGLAYLHYDHNLHRDIKPGNVLMNSNGFVKLSDFGISKVLEDTQAMSETVTGTFRYMSPERLMGEHYNSSADMWSVGIMLIELWQQEYPFEHASYTPVELYSELQDIDLESLLPPEDYPQFLAEFIAAMLRRAPEDRYSADELVQQSDWFDFFQIDSMDAAREGLMEFFGTSDAQYGQDGFDDGYSEEKDYANSGQYCKDDYDGGYDNGNGNYEGDGYDDSGDDVGTRIERGAGSYSDDYYEKRCQESSYDDYDDNN